MKEQKFILAAAVILLTTSINNMIPAPPAYAATTSSAALTQGMSNVSVTGLQQNLKILGFYTYQTVTGYFGTITAQAVKDFQKAYSLPVTGNADAATQINISHALTKRTMMSDAMNLLRVPYVWGGVTTQGFDCSGFVYFLFQTHGIAMTRTTSKALFDMGASIQQANLQPGDLVFFAIATPGVVDHVGFYMGNGQFLSATRSAGIYSQSMTSTYWAPKYLGAKRVY
ncbi:hydrolase Nlp/P60 [Paenibacillus sp. SYP-B3998]|uniref:Hydrolase Nlp/P60 n=1 Tax=Paenibacillus sp. SYP-B3998 TaxID=2678564 RepID=A0A6G4A077_9BACL|nr:NlpC/P60 family protein [Paenibacillus sp. SYP-B3998]NEW07792.1 hydrolase Nlp/P60 [Paenibacillus sp. SYP-B3998]